MAGKVVLTGNKKLNRQLQLLRLRDAKKIVRTAARPSLRPVLTEAQRLAPVSGRRQRTFRVKRDAQGFASSVAEGRGRVGRLKRSLTIRALRRSRSRYGARVTTRYGEFKGETFYGGFQEWGWKIGKRGRVNRKQVEGQHFMRDAANNKRKQALTIYRQHIRQLLLEHFRK